MIEITSLIKGPFVVVATVPDQSGPIITTHCPEGGFKTKQEALDWATHYDESDGSREAGITYQIAGLRTPGEFMQFMSW